MKNEIWKDIENYEGYYQISNLGRLKSLERNIPRFNNGKIRDYIQKERIVKLNKNSKNGYYKVYLRKNNEYKRFYIYRLVARYFLTDGLEKYNNKKFNVNHKDGNKINNNVENLEWVTRSENSIHSYYILNNKIKNNVENIYPKRKVLQLDRYTLKEINRFESIREAKEKTKINHISCVCRGERKTAGGYVWRYLN